MTTCRRNILGVAIVATLSSAGAVPAGAQSACITPNCVFAGKPTVCQNRAVPRTPTVLMTTVSASFMFDPQNPKIEPGDCITWRAATVTHSASDNQCTDDSLCGSPAPAACQWDSANVSSGSATPTSTCHYDSGTFPPAAAEAFYCRIHASPTTGTMRGTLRVTSTIQLVLAKDLGTNSVKLSWTGGGVTGDISYKVARNTGGDPLMPVATTTTVNPDGGVLGTTFTDVGDLTDLQTRYYLVRNKQTNEP